MTIPFYFLVEWRNFESPSCHGDAFGRHSHVPAASARVDDHAFGDAAPGKSFVSVIDPPPGEFR